MALRGLFFVMLARLSGKAPGLGVAADPRASASLARARFGLRHGRAAIPFLCAMSGRKSPQAQVRYRVCPSSSPFKDSIMTHHIDDQLVQCIRTYGVLIQQEVCAAELAFTLYPSQTRTRDFSVQGRQYRFDGQIHDEHLSTLTQEVLALLAPQRGAHEQAPSPRSAIFRYVRQETAGPRLIGQPKQLEGRFTDYGTGTLETPEGAAFRVVDGVWVTDGHALQPGSGFVYGPEDRYSGTILAQQTPWQPT